MHLVLRFTIIAGARIVLVDDEVAGADGCTYKPGPGPPYEGVSPFVTAAMLTSTLLLLAVDVAQVRRGGLLNDLDLVARLGDCSHDAL